jgi:PAS domain S-box-containing protein
MSLRPDADGTGSDLLQLVSGITDYAIFLLDATGHIATWNAGAERIKGYRPEEIIGRHFSVFYPPDDIAAHKPDRELEIAARVGRFEDEGWRIRKDGSRFWASVVITALRSPDGTLRGFGKVTRDLGERWLSGRLEGILDAIDDAVVVRDRNCDLVWVNQAAAKLGGWASAADLIASRTGTNSPTHEVTDERGKPLTPTELPAGRVIHGDANASMVVRVREKKTGRVWWASVQARPILGAFERPELSVSVWRDITAERRRQEAARYLSRAAKVLTESLDYGMTMSRLARLLVPELADWCSVDVLEDGELRNIAVAHVDPAKVQLARELQSRYPARLDGPTGVAAVVKTGRSQLVPALDDVTLAASSRGNDDLLRILRELGLRSAMIVPLRARDDVLGAMTMISAESQRTYDESDLALAEELGSRAGTAIDNARAYGEARAAIKLRDEFLSVAGHELRTPLTALQLQLQSLDAAFARGQVAAEPARWEPRVHKTVGHAHRLQRLIDELLDVSRITSGRLSLERETMDLGELAREVVERHTSEALRTGSIVNLETRGDTHGNWDRTRLDQVLTNLLSNAVKYGAGKPIDVRVTGSGDGDGRVRVVVRDQGIGIEPAAQPRIFGRFERAVSERHYGGFGLGLWIVHELVEAHGGHVHFESEPGRGSTFYVELPTEMTNA